MKKIISIIFVIMIYFSFAIKVSAETTNVSCTYSLNKDKIYDYCYNSEICKDLIGSNSTLTVVIYLDGTYKDEILDKNFPKFTLGGVSGNYVNNVTTSKNDGLYPLVKYNEEFVSAKTYYEKTKSCPPFFSIMVTDYGLTGSFNSYIKDTGYISYTFPIEEINYDEDFNKEDEIFSCSLYSSDLYLRELKVNLQINYTTKEVSFGNFSTDGTSEAISALNKYKENFDFTKKNVCPVNELQICSVLEYTYIYPKDFSDVHPSASCSVLDLTEQLVVGDSYCKYILDKTIEMKKTKEGYYNNLFYVKNYCNIVLKHQNYEATEYSCFDICLHLKDYLPNNINDKEFNCGFSEKLIQWIANIVKWIKYIVPVIVIVMGILDFIKAIANEKDDEMKKAQGHFVKRLIAAALIFITPFIIEFILDKMGFAANGCGIIDL